MRIRDLMQLADLRLRCLAGESHLDRQIRWVLSTDVLDPRGHLSGGELVLTGLMWRRSAEDSEAFVAALAESDVACLAAGEAAYGGVPEDLVRACVKHDVPLVEIPQGVSFSHVSGCVHRALIDNRHEDLADLLRRRRKLVSSVSRHGGLDALLALSADDPEVPFWLLTATGRVPAIAPSHPAGAEGETLAREFLTATSFPHRARIRSGGRSADFSIFPVGDDIRPRVIGWFLACEGDYRTWSDGTRESMTELAALVSLERERREEVRRLENAQLERLVTDTLAGNPGEPGELAGQLARMGLDQSPYVVVAGAVTPASAGAIARTVMVDLLVPFSDVPQSIVHATAVGTEAIAVIPMRKDVAALTEYIRSRAGLMSLGLDRHRLAIGISTAAVGPEALLSALGEARQARKLAELQSGALRVVATQEIDSFEQLLAAVPAEVRAAYRDRFLGPLLAYDNAHHGDLVRTLEVFLETACSWSRCANALHIHVNTLRYRIQRIEALTGKSLTSLQGRLEFTLALRVS
ncbi:PucR family transcriptional regulator [Amycolatopsis jejuensis]|uniref:PucR family transcriptional regulator n=1 Tax=Amycolatopsis jejuensis TaxID=330084 RepID=UPI000524B5D5|nr:PucR family transcriptional regulator [Amycolatopsis jejuensis]